MHRFDPPVLADGIKYLIRLGLTTRLAVTDKITGLLAGGLSLEALPISEDLNQQPASEEPKPLDL